MHERDMLLQIELPDELEVQSSVPPHFTGNDQVYRKMAQDPRQAFQQIAQTFIFANEAKEQQNAVAVEAQFSPGLCFWERLSTEVLVERVWIDQNLL